MALTRSYRETVLARIQRDREFTAALFAEAVSALTEGDKETSLSILRDLVHAHISFKRLAEMTGLDEKSLHRMLGANGNPTAEHLALLLKTIERAIHVRTTVKAQAIRSRRGRTRTLALAFA